MKKLQSAFAVLFSCILISANAQGVKAPVNNNATASAKVSTFNMHNPGKASPAPKKPVAKTVPKRIKVADPRKELLGHPNIK